MLFVHKTTYLACADICQPFLVGLDTFANLLCPDSPDSPTFAKGLFWEKCDSPRHIRTSNLPFWRIWGEWPLLSFNQPWLQNETYLQNSVQLKFYNLEVKCVLHTVYVFCMMYYKIGKCFFSVEYFKANLCKSLINLIWSKRRYVQLRFLYYDAIELKSFNN